MTSVTVSAKTVNDAITEASIQLGVESAKIDYEVITEGSAGFLGIGRRQAVIRAWKKEEEKKEFLKKETVKKEAEHKEGSKKESSKKEISKKEVSKKEVLNKEVSNKENSNKENSNKEGSKKESIKKEASKKETAKKESVKKDDTKKEVVKKEKPQKPAKSDNHKKNKPAKETPVQDDLKEEVKSEVVEEKKEEKLVEVTPETKAACEAFLKDVLKTMSMEVKLASTIDEDGALCIEMEGENMGILIGKRGQTLDALQYLTNRVANKMQDGYVRVKLDTENYRQRRKETLENLAKNIAHKVKRTKKAVALEPMNPYERRIIHSVLQNDRYVSTHSEGEEPYRKVVITLNRRS